MRRWIYACMVAVSTWVGTGAAHGQADQDLTPGLTHFYNLEFEQALEEFERLAKADAKSAVGWNRIAYTLMYREMFRVGALESELVTGNNSFLRRPKMQPKPEDEARFQAAIDKALAISEANLKANPNDVNALYSMGVAVGFRGNWNYMTKRAGLDALRDAAQTRKYHTRVTEIDPKFVDAYLTQGLHEYIIGSLPWYYRSMVFVAGFRGDRAEGLRKLERVAREGKISRIDAQILLAAIYRREKRSQQAVPFIQNLADRFPRNFLFKLELAQMYGDLGQKDKALAQYREVERLKAAGTPGFQSLLAEKINFFEGNLLFWYDDLDGALTQLKKASNKAAEMDLNTAIYTWLRLGQVYDLKGDRARAKQAYQQVIAAAPESEAAKEAKQFSDSPFRRKRQSG